MRSGWWTARSVTLHVALAVFVPVFILLGLWQLSRAVHGNLLSWAYTFEWPFFAAYATWMWWKLVHEEVARCAADAATSLTTAVAPAPDAAPTTRASAGSAPEASGEQDEAELDEAKRESAIATQLGWNPYDDAGDPELAAYNRYLASLHTAERTGRQGS